MAGIPYIGPDNDPNKDITGKATAAVKSFPKRV